MSKQILQSFQKPQRKTSLKPKLRFCFALVLVLIHPIPKAMTMYNDWGPFYFYFILFTFFRATLAAHGGSQARD